MPEITTITSEALQATIRRLLPSQRGFGNDLEASNVIQPIIDLTATAEGSALAPDLQRALACDSQTAFAINGTSSTVVNSTGFWRIFGSSSNQASNTVNRNCSWFLDSGASSKKIWAHVARSGAINGEVTQLDYDFVIFLDTGDALRGNCDTSCSLTGSLRQIADRYGNIVNPSGFSFE